MRCQSGADVPQNVQMTLSKRPKVSNIAESFAAFRKFLNE